MSDPTNSLCVPEFIIFNRTKCLHIPPYKVFAHMVQESSMYPYGSMARSGIEIRSVEKQCRDGTKYVTLGAFTTCCIPKDALVTFYGGEKKYMNEISMRSHAMRLPRSMFAEDGKGLSLLFQRHETVGMVSLPIKYPNIYVDSFRSLGIGYMLNHASKRTANCVLKYANPPSSMEEIGYSPVPFFVSKMNIGEHEELTFDYNTSESRLYY